MELIINVLICCIVKTFGTTDTLYDSEVEQLKTSKAFTKQVTPNSSAPCPNIANV
jgi:hypothetical protein